MNKNFYFYRCYLEERQAKPCEKGLLSATEVVQAICDADFQRNGSYIKDPKADSVFYHEYAKRPRKGLYKLRMVKKTDLSRLDVLIDTRMYPSFVLIEKHKDRLEDIPEIIDVMERSFNGIACKYNWDAKLQEHKTNEVQYLEEFISAMAYLNERDEKVDFQSIVITETIAPAVKALLDRYIKGKKKPKQILAPFRAAKDAGAIGKLTKSIFIKTYGNILGNSISVVDKYMSDNYIWNVKDKVYIKMRDEFRKLVEKVN